MSRDRSNPGQNQRRRRSAAVEAALARPSARQLSRRERERFQRRALFGAIAAVAGVVVAIVGYGAFREFVYFPSQPVALVAGEGIPLRMFTDSLRDEMRTLQSQVGSEARDATNPGQAGSSVNRLISAQETLPEDVLEKEIENTVIRQEAKTRGIGASPDEVNAKINANLAAQREVLAQPTPTPTETRTPVPSRTPLPEGFEPTPTPEPTQTPDPLTPTATRDPLTPTATREPFPTRLTATPVVTPTPAPTLDPQEFDKAYNDLKPLLRNESLYRRSLELQILRQKVRDAVGASAPAHGPQAHVLRLAASTSDEAQVALIQISPSVQITVRTLLPEYREVVLAVPGVLKGAFSLTPEGDALPAPNGVINYRTPNAERVNPLVVGALEAAGAEIVSVDVIDSAFPFEEVVGQASERPAEGRTSGDLGWVALGAETKEFDDVVFSASTPMDEWTADPFKAGNHWEIVRVLERREDGEHDTTNLEKMRDRLFKEWLDAAKQGPEVQRDLSAQERQWAVDRASKGIFEETKSRT
jgi:parvulin-like peptidyl-prolyl isomerase